MPRAMIPFLELWAAMQRAKPFTGLITVCKLSSYFINLLTNTKSLLSVYEGRANQSQAFEAIWSNLYISSKLIVKKPTFKRST